MFTPCAVARCSIASSIGIAFAASAGIAQSSGRRFGTVAR
jgi:hypothetical protein